MTWAAVFAAAADWPAARAACARGTLRRSLEDFVVDEELGFEPAGAGEHLYLRVAKRDRTTPQARTALARCFGVPAVDVGYAGMKDRRAVTRQWFSVRAPADDAASPDDPGITIERRCRHPRKLRVGDHRGNRFEIRVTGADGDWRRNLPALAREGFPNYFGSQRFGRGGGNADAALAWARAGRPRCRRFVRGLHISTLRALIFNDVLAARVGSGTWRRLIDGDLPAADGAPTGPLWGRGRTPAAGAARELEQAAAAGRPEAARALEFVGSGQERRALVALPRELAWEGGGSEFRLRFALPPGAYASRLLAEVVTAGEAG